VAERTRTSLVPPRIASLPAAREQLEYSSRSIVFASDGARLLRAWGPPERPWVVGVEPGPDRWTVTAWGAGPAEARRAARELFSLDHPIEEFYARVRREPVLAGTERRFRGLRLPRDPSVYESLLHAIIGQQLSVQAALAIQRRLFERAGSYLTADGTQVPCVPAPARLLELGTDGLRATGLSRAKVAALLELAGPAGRRLADDATLASDPLDRALERLVELRGVGRWTAENCLLRGTGRPDVFVAGDLGIRVALDEYGVVRRAASEERARAWGERWYPGWGSYATLYLWRKLVADRRAAAG
jgi:DNA-3-methyladenine glycosylase II